MIHVLLRFYKQAEQRIKDATLVSLGLTRLLLETAILLKPHKLAGVAKLLQPR